MFRSDGERRSFSITRDMTVVGRREDCDLRIPLTEVSRKHARLVRDGDALRLEDLGSSNGTYLNGQRVQEAILSAGDSVQIGPIVFVLQVDGMPGDEELRPITADIHEQSSAPAVASDAAPLLPPIPPDSGDDLGGELGTLDSGVPDEFEALEPLAMDDVEPSHEPAPQLAEHVDDGPIEMSPHESNASAHQAAPRAEEEEEFGEELLMTPDGDMEFDIAPREEAKPVAKAPAPPAAGRSAPPVPVAPAAAPAAFKAPPPPPAPRPMAAAPPAPPVMPPVSASAPPSPKPSAVPPPPPAPTEAVATDEPQEDWDSFLVLDEEETTAEAEPELVEFGDLASAPAAEAETEPLALADENVGEELLAHGDEHAHSPAEPMELADEPSAPAPTAVAQHDAAPSAHSGEHSHSEQPIAWDGQTATKPLSFADEPGSLEPAPLEDEMSLSETPMHSDGDSDPELDALFADLADEEPTPFSAHESGSVAIPPTGTSSKQHPTASPSNGNGGEKDAGHAMHAHSEADVMPLLGDDAALEELPLLDDEGDLGILPDNAGHGADTPHHPHA